MKKNIIFSSLILSSFLLSACGKPPVMKQMYKDAFGQLPQAKLSISEMMAGGAVFSCSLESGGGPVKLSYKEGKLKIDGLMLRVSDTNEETFATSTELFDGEKLYVLSSDLAYVIKAEDYIRERTPQEAENNQKSVLQLLTESFERSELPYQCKDEQFENDYFVPKVGIDYKIATSSVL